ncbi:MAG: FtsX-like permease family protein [Peptoniphilaceae bacterium]|nr:FtsX-like permease family protein [Peptoniphilaceae bacterium]MDY6019028.1 FtsX-like permease family protein [Anaerococcus sp.]
MKTEDRLIMAFRNLWRRKSRTILTILSVVIGTISIIMMLSLGLGMQEQQKQMVESFGGLENIEIMTDATSSQKIDQNTANKFKNIKGVRVVIPHKDVYAEIKVKGKDKYNVEAYQGIRVIPNEVFKNIKKEDFDQGTNLSPSDKNSLLLTSQVEVTEEIKLPGQEGYSQENVEDFDFLGSNFYIRLGYKDEEESPKFGLEQNLPVNGGEEDTSDKPNYADIPVKVKGKLSKNSFLTGSYGFINESTYKTLEKEDKKLQSSQLNTDLDSMGNPVKNNSKYIYTGISVVCNDYQSVKNVEQEIKEMGYQTQSNTEMIDNINDATTKIMMILGGIGSIAFIVSAIGIINTMLMSIYERQKEIGVMKVIGASIADIRSMFLLESGFIGFFGGVLGLVISLVLSALFNKLFLASVDPSVMGNTEPTSLFSIPVWLAVAGVSFSALVGVMAGYLPAKRATKLSAIETLRSN